MTNSVTIVTTSVMCVARLNLIVLRAWALFAGEIDLTEYEIVPRHQRLRTTLFPLMRAMT